MPSVKGQRSGLRERNSRRLKLIEVSTAVLLEVQLVNPIVHFEFNALSEGTVKRDLDSLSLFM